MDEQQIFENIKSKIDVINELVYKEFNFEKIVRNKLTTPSVNKFEGDLILLKNRISKQKDIGKPSINNMKNVDTCMLDINEEHLEEEHLEEETITEKIQWKNLEVELKLEKFKNYMECTNYKNFPPNLYDRLIEMINNNKLDKKKYIIYNENTTKIHDLPIINYDSNIQEYYLRSDRENKKKKISKIFK